MKRYIRSAKTNFSRNANRRSVSLPEPEDSGVSEEAYNALMEFGNSLKGTRISGVVEGNTNSYEIGATIEDYKLSEHQFDLIFSSVTCFSDPELTVGYHWTTSSKFVNFSGIVDISNRKNTKYQASIIIIMQLGNMIAM